MSYQKHVLVTGLALFLLALGASVECRADGIEKEVPPAISATQKKTFLCARHLPPCIAAVRSSQATAHHAIRQGNDHDSSHLVLGTNIAKDRGQTSDKPVFGRRVNFTMASMEMGTVTHMGRLALNMMLDSHYRGAIFNSVTPFEAMQVSLNYSHAW